ncbi:MAG: hypothetical protein KJO49_11790 [Bacteroidia bacterium]|nr:hypothetical protein [Bacteroidia bacterium]MBT8269363.1 hypothetical protein [Bacteroidia bacterium]NNK69181.1 hypothetical protein [Flavobacteriaceae bacterium]
MTSKAYMIQVRPISILVMFFIVSMSFAQDPEFKFGEVDKPLILDNPDLVIWHVKAMRPNGKIYHVKAIDKDGNIHPVKAIQDSEQTQLLGVKAFVDGKELPIKLIVKEDDRYYPLKAIDKEGNLINIKALTDKNEILDVKGVSKTGNIVHIRAIRNDSVFYNLVAISPQGRTNMVKGIKMTKEEVETVINGVKVFAHVKALAKQ